MSMEDIFSEYLSFVEKITQLEKAYKEVLEEVHKVAVNSDDYNLEKTALFYFNFGNIFLLKQDFNEALIWYKYAVENGHALSAKLISSIYKEDKINILKWITQAYLLGYKSTETVIDVYNLTNSVIEELNLRDESFIVSYKELILRYTIERDSLKDIKDYFFLTYRTKISISDIDKYALADYLLANEQYEESIIWYKELAELGNVAPMHDIGGVNDVLGNKEEAYYWYKKAAILGNTKAQNDLASILRDRDCMSESLYWFNKAIEGNDSLALYTLGEMYSKGDEKQQIPKNLNKAIEYYTKSANTGFINAEYKLALIYENGEGEEEHDEYEDYKTSLYWYERVVRNTTPL